jgi:hypothetical protein
LALTSQSALDVGFDLSAFTSPTLLTVDAQASGSISGNAVVTLTGTTPIASLNVGSAAGVALFQVNSAITVNTLNYNAGSAKVDNDCGNLIVGNLSVGGSSFAVFQSCPSATAVVTLTNINFPPSPAAATLHIAGGVAHIGVNGGTSGSITGTGNLKLSGGVSVDGNIPQTVTINVAASGRSAPVVVIDTGAKLNISGNVQGTGSTIVVNGQFIFGSTTASVDPKVVVNAGATLVIASATALQAKAIDISASATLVLSANANKGAIFVEKMAKCLGTVRIELATTASAFISSSSAGVGIGFTYSTNNVPNDLKNCAVEVVDSSGATFTLTSTTAASVGRRLLASSGTATWGSNSMTYNMGQHSAAFSFAVAPVVMIGVIGLFM